jgi:hypothetical protein
VFSRNEKELIEEVGRRYLAYWNELDQILNVEALQKERSQKADDSNSA